MILRHIAHALALLALLLFPPLVITAPSLASYGGFVLAWFGIATLVLAVGILERSTLHRPAPRDDQEYAPSKWSADQQTWFVGTDLPTVKTKGDSHAAR